MSLTSDILDLRTIHLSLYTEWNNFYNYFGNGKIQCDAESWAGLAAVFDNLQQVALRVRALYMGATPSMRNTTYDILHYIDENLGDGAEVTMDAILSAMITSDFNDLQKFIGIVDAYRVALWNAPFNAEFYGALARGFETWPQY